MTYDPGHAAKVAEGPLVAADWSAERMAARLESLYFQMLGRRSGETSA